MNKKLLLKLVLALIFSLLVVSFLTKNIFYANTPTIRPDAVSVLSSVVNNMFNTTSGLLARLLGSKTNFQTTEQRLATMPLKKISTGVYAKDLGNVMYREIRGSEITWTEYKVMVKGKEVTVKIPQGTNPPSITDLEKFIK